MTRSKLRLRIFGSVVGLTAPLMALCIFYYWNFSYMEPGLFLDRILLTKLFGPILSLCVVINLLAFFSFIWTDRDDGAWGVLLVTICYGFFVLFLKLFG